MNIAILGPSGAGKGTQAVRLAAQFGRQHLSTGDLLRENLEARNALGLLARKYMDRGELVPDEVVEAMIEERLQAARPNDTFLFDGFPRTPEQAAFLDDVLVQSGRRLDAVLYLEVSEEETQARLEGRLVCGQCHGAYHRRHKLPRRPGVCDDCGAPLVTRADDNPEMTRRRWQVFRRHLGPILDYYRPTARLLPVDGAGPPDVVQHLVLERLQAFSQGVLGPAVAHQDATLEPMAVKPPATPVTEVSGEGGLNFVLLGGPGSGKGTQAEALGCAFRLCHVASGDLFRENLRENTRLGQLAKTYMNRGELVPDDITEAMVDERLTRADTADGFLLDGFPRTLPQAEALTEMLDRVDRPLAAVIYIRVGDASLVDRLSGRWICRSCQTPYHRLFKPPICEGRCDKCEGELYQRDDDQPETVRARLKTFHKQTEPLIAYYEGAGLLHAVDGEGPVAEVTARARAAVESVRSLRNAG